ncbi:MAG TPA: hypothetical protein VLA74_13695 [Nitrososphaeraceae archaeon]|nr:hypothetical protein [Nitrososphaeraceae archaeon]
MIPPCSLSSLYALTNIEYLLFPSSTSEIFSTARNSFLTILLNTCKSHLLLLFSYPTG